MSLATLVFLVMLIPDTDRPTVVLMQAYPTVKECREVLEYAPKELKSKYACIRIDLKPEEEGIAI